MYENTDVIYHKYHLGFNEQQSILFPNSLSGSDNISFLFHNILFSNQDIIILLPPHNILIHKNIVWSLTLWLICCPNQALKKNILGLKS